MSRQVGSLHRSNSHPANLQNPLPIIPLFAFPPPDSPQANTSSGMNSDTNSAISTTILKFNNSDIETPDEFADSEPSPSTHTPTSSATFPKPSFQPKQSHSQHTSPYTPSQVTPTYSPFNNERSTNNSCRLWIGWKEGFGKVVELVGVCVEGDGSESANSSGVSISELLNFEVVV